MWEYRELLYFLVWRDIKIRYRQTFLGIAWGILQPVLMMVVFTIIFGRFVGIPSDGIPYSLFALSGLLQWTFFASAVTNSANSFVGNAHLITKVYFPRVMIPAAAVFTAVVDLALGGLVLVAIVGGMGIELPWSAFALPLLALLEVLLALAVGTLLSALNVKYRDFQHAVPFLMQLWLFATPVLYPASIFPTQWRWALHLNPMTGFVETFRSLLFGNPIDAPNLFLSIAVTTVALPASVAVLRRMERQFADII
jgi:lipopolysaccharide transport system permease protein